MTFQEAEKTIREMLSHTSLITMRYEKDIWQDGKIEPKCTIVFVWGDNPNTRCEHVQANTWFSVIQKLRIFLEPDPSSQSSLTDEPMEDIDGKIHAS